VVPSKSSKKDRKEKDSASKGKKKEGKDTGAGSEDDEKQQEKKPKGRDWNFGVGQRPGECRTAISGFLFFDRHGLNCL
jgi:hypothetical protein